MHLQSFPISDRSAASVDGSMAAIPCSPLVVAAGGPTDLAAIAEVDAEAHTPLLDPLSTGDQEPDSGRDSQVNRPLMKAVWLIWR